MSDPGVLTRIMELADEYARAVADTPHGPSRLERMLATERIERARDTLTAYAAQVADERDTMRALLAEWDKGMYDGRDFLRRVRLVLYGDAGLTVVSRETKT